VGKINAVVSRLAIVAVAGGSAAEKLQSEKENS
jgi:hypothetical protein